MTVIITAIMLAEILLVNNTLMDIKGAGFSRMKTPLRGLKE